MGIRCGGFIGPVSGSGGGAVDSVFGRTGVVAAVANDYAAAQIGIVSIGSPPNDSLSKTIDREFSAGWVKGGEFTPNVVPPLADIAAGCGFIRATNDDIAPLIAIAWDELIGAALTDLTLNFIYVEYNAGAPQIAIDAAERTDYNTNILLCTIYRDGLDLHISSPNRHAIIDGVGKVLRRFKDTEFFERTSGGVTVEVGTRSIAVSGGAWWEGLVPFTTVAVDTNVAGTFGYYYDADGAGDWTLIAASTQIDNLQYNNPAGGLATLDNQKYSVHWVYVGMDGEYYVIYGTVNGTLGEAQDAVAPSVVPPFFAKHVRLIAKIVIQKSAGAFEDITTAFETSLTGSTGISRVQDDPTPVAGGDFDIGGNSFISVSDGDIPIEPDGVGNVLMAATADNSVMIGPGAPESKLHVKSAKGGTASGPDGIYPFLLEESIVGGSGGFIGMALYLSRATPGDGVSMAFAADNSAGERMNYALLSVIPSVVTDGLETAEMIVYTRDGGSFVVNSIFKADGGFIVGNPSGGSKGPGAINAVDVYDNGVNICYVIEAEKTGDIDLLSWDADFPDQIVPKVMRSRHVEDEAGNLVYTQDHKRDARGKPVLDENGEFIMEEPKPLHEDYEAEAEYTIEKPNKYAREFHARMERNLDPDMFYADMLARSALPAMPTRDEWRDQGGLSIGDTLRRLQETVEVVIVHAQKDRMEHRDRMEELEARIAALESA